MKIMKKLVAAISAIAMISSLAVFSVSAAESRVVTISVTDGSGSEITSLGVGEEVVVTVTMDHIAGITALGYDLHFDTEKLAADDTLQGSGPSANKCPTWLDLTWWNDTRVGNTVLGSYFGKPTVNRSDNRCIVAFAGAYAIEEPDEEQNAVIGKFHFTTTQEISASNPLKFTLGRATTGEPESTPMSYQEVTVPAQTAPEINYENLNAQIAAFKALKEADYTTESWAAAKAAYDAAVALVDAADDQAAVDAAAEALADAIAGLQKMPEPEPEITVEQTISENKYDDEHKTVGIGGTVTVPEGKSFTSLVFSLNNGTKNGTYTWEFGAAISATVTFGLNIWNTPADVDVTVNSVTAQ